MADLPSFIAAAGADGQVLLLADQGAYAATKDALSIYAGGTDGHPVTIRGIDSDGDPMRAVFDGTRSDPFDPSDDSKDEVFRLLDGADNLTIRDLSFTNIGYAAIRIGADISNLTVENIDFTNVQRAFEDYKSGDNLTASISGLTLRNLDIDGFSRGAIRLNDDTHDVLIEDVRGDAMRHDDAGVAFPIGVHLEGTVHDVVIRRVTMMNADDHNSASYWNGDGFATEAGVYDIRFEDTASIGNTDGGYDLKSSTTTLVRTIADDNGRNYRLWAKDMVLDGVISLDPHLDGGNSTQNHIYFAKGATATITGAVLSDHVPTTAFQLTEGNAVATVVDLVAMIGLPSALSKKLSDSVITVNGVDYGTSVVTGASFATSTQSVAAYADGTGAHWLIGGSADDVLRGGDGVDRLEGGAGDDILIGGAGDDMLVGGEGRDVLIGQDGMDVADYSNASSGIQIDLHSGAPGGGAAGDLLLQIESLIGSGYDDSLYGDAQENLLSGGAGTDWIAGRDGNDMLAGGAGSDHLDGGAGDDLLSGGAGADDILGGDGIDTADYSDSAAGVLVDLVAGLGAGGDADGDRLRGIEAVIGSAFADTLIADAGPTRLVGGAGGDTLIGTGGDDIADYTASNAGIGIDLAAHVGHGGDAEGDVLSGLATVIGSAYADTIAGDATANQLASGAGNDVLAGAGGNDTLTGGDGDDQIDGGGGDDLLIGGAGADALEGGDGFDTADYAASAQGVHVDLRGGTATGGGAQGDTLHGVEALVGTAFADVLIGDGGANRLAGAAGDDDLVGGAGGDVLDGGDGIDTADYAGGDTAITLDLATGTGEGDTLIGIEVIVGSAHDDTILATNWTGTVNGGAGADTLVAGAGNDVMIGGTGADHLDGGGGFDIADYSASASGVIVDLGIGLGLAGDAFGDVLNNIEALVGSRYGDMLSGNASDNDLVGGGGGDLLIGGGGVDFADYRTSSAAVQLSLATGGTAGDAAGDVFLGITGVYGSAFADRITGDNHDNILVGGAGADLLDGGAGTDSADYSASVAAVTVDLAAGTGIGGDAAGDTLGAIENVVGSAGGDTITGNAVANVLNGGLGTDTITGGAGADTLVGGGGNDLLDGGSDGDVMIGGAGDDIYLVDSSDDVVMENANEGSDRVRTTLHSYTLGNNVEALTYLGTDTFTGYGNDLANSFSGSAAVETLYGYGGDDKFSGSAGADTIYGGAGKNSMDYSSAKAAIVVNLTTNVNSGGDAGGDLLYDIYQISGTNYADDITGDAQANILYGRGGVDTLRGMDGDDRLDGGAGADMLYGGTGNDLYVVDDAGDQTFEDANGGSADTVSTAIEGWTLADNIENLKTSSATSFTGTGNALANTITGGTAKDFLYGLAGADTLLGMAGDDVLTGGAGDDTIDGGAGFDMAVYSGVATDYRLSRSGSVLTLTDVRAGAPDGTDTISNVEAFQIGGTILSLASLLAEVPQAPDGIAFAGTLAENAAPGTLVGTALGNDPNPGDTLSYALVGDANGRFAIDATSGAITVTDGATFDYETEPAIALAITVRDALGQSLTQSFVVAVGDVNEAPGHLALSGKSIAEDAPAGTVVGTLAALDPDAGDTLHYTLTDSAGGRFIVDPETGAVRLASGAVLDPAGPGYGITAQVQDAAGLSTSAQFTITIAKPVPYQGDAADTKANTFLIDTNAGGASGNLPITNFGLKDVLVTTKKISDSDNDGIVTAGAGGVLSVGTSKITMTAIDGGAITALELDGKVSKGGIDYYVYSQVGTTATGTGAAALPPAGSSSMALSNKTIAENSGTGTLVGIVTGTPSNGATRFGYKLLDDAGGRFAIDAATGQIRVAAGAPLDYEATKTYTLQVAAANNLGTSFQRGYTISVTNVNEAPTDLHSSGGRVAAGAAGGTIVATFSAKDPDAGDTLSYALTNDAGGRFAIDAATGVLSVAQNALVSDPAGYAVTVRVSDAGGLSLAQSFTIPVISGNEAPTGAMLSGGTIAENSPVGTIVGTVHGTDPDAGESFTYALIDAGGGRFAIDAASGVLKSAGALDYETQQSIAVTVRVTDSGGLSYDQQLHVALTNVVEAQSYAGTAAADTFSAPSADTWTVTGGGGNDTLVTLGGNDSVTGGAGDDLIATGAGKDMIRFSGGGEGFDQVDGGDGDDTIVAMANNTVIGLHAIANVEHITAGSYTGVTVGGSAVADILDFSGVSLIGITRIVGNDGDDIVTGSAGADVISGGAGNDTLSGGSGDDIFQVYSSSGTDSYDGGTGADTIQILSSNATMLLGKIVNVETISAASVPGAVLGGSQSDDVIDFSSVSLVNIARISGAGGNDTIIGSGGADVIAGGGGRDTLTGGGGADTFDFDTTAESAPGDADLIVDFHSGEDHMDLTTIDASTKASGNQAFTFIGDSAFGNVAGQVRVDYADQSGPWVYGDTDGDGVSDFAIHFTGPLTLGSSDFFL